MMKIISQIKQSKHKKGINKTLQMFHLSQIWKQQL